MPFSACGPIPSYRAIVRGYIQRYRHRSDGFSSYAKLPNLKAVIQHAALCREPLTGKRHSHQRRIPLDVLIEARDRLLRVNLRTCRSFHDLITTVTKTIGPIRGIGELTIYDISTRIGAFLGLEPDRIYLHAGTREGARAFVPVAGREWLTPDELPPAFEELSPSEIEDCLCIWKNERSTIAAPKRRSKRRQGGRK